VVDSRIDELRRRLERDPGSRLFAQLAEEYRKAGNHAEAIRVARSGLAHHPSYPSARLTLGRALLESGDPAGARAELETALREAPDNILASRFLGQALETQGDFNAALERYEATLKMTPGDRQLELQIRAVQKRIEAAAAPGGGEGPRAVAATLPRIGGPPGEDEGSSLPPTIRIHVPGSRGGRPQRPAEPPPPVPTTIPGPQEAGWPAPPLPAAEAAAFVTQATGVTGHVGSSDEASETEATAVSVEPFYESDVAPTLPTAPTFEVDPSSGREGSPPTREAAALDFTLEDEPIEVEAVEVEDVGPLLVPVGGAQPEWNEPAATEDAGPGGPGATPFSSSTLAELYFRQGLVDRAVEVYRQLLGSEPENGRARARLAEILALSEPVAVDGPVPGVYEERAARRRGLERTIARLDALLKVIRRR